MPVARARGGEDRFSALEPLAGIALVVRHGVGVHCSRRVELRHPLQRGAVLGRLHPVDELAVVVQRPLRRDREHGGRGRPEVVRAPPAVSGVLDREVDEFVGVGRQRLPCREVGAVERGVRDADVLRERQAVQLPVPGAGLPRLRGDVGEVRVVLDGVTGEVRPEVLEQRIHALTEAGRDVPAGHGHPVRQVAGRCEHGRELLAVRVAVADLELELRAHRLVDGVEVLVALGRRDGAPQRRHGGVGTAVSRRRVECLDKRVRDLQESGGRAVHAGEVRLREVDRNVVRQHRLVDLALLGGARRCGSARAAAGEDHCHSGDRGVDDGAPATEGTACCLLRLHWRNSLDCEGDIALGDGPGGSVATGESCDRPRDPRIDSNRRSASLTRVRNRWRTRKHRNEVASGRSGWFGGNTPNSSVDPRPPPA